MNGQDICIGKPISRTHNVIERWCARRTDLSLLILRVVVGVRLRCMTQDNVSSWARMLEFRDFMVQFGFPFPLFCAVLSVICQFGGGLALVLGPCTRFAGLVIAVNFVVAIWMVDSKQPYPGAFAALALVAAGLCLIVTGAGFHSLDRAWRRAS